MATLNALATSTHSLPDEQKKPYTLVMGMRSSVFEAFRHLQRPAAAAPAITRIPSGR
ncbi:hypothetical protein [Roseateles violae]|uniref:Uncharacterized protein n=1 Tax=Roseateles violae TaxID=3058042 RepID=A0ABT8DT31_9BURK|nr:hypothetical protein [Pelomonas sp. PFR6]MDN3919321.1 hypothetical protein [Pelomonas sp. PFR6]